MLPGIQGVDPARDFFPRWRGLLHAIDPAQVAATELHVAPVRHKWPPHHSVQRPFAASGRYPAPFSGHLRQLGVPVLA